MHFKTSSIILCLCFAFTPFYFSHAHIDDVFKINKLNLVWTKAQNSLGSTKLKNLREDLLKHELDEISLKRMKSHNQDKDGLFEAAVRKKLVSLLTKYALDRYIDDLHLNEKSDRQQKIPKEKSSQVGSKTDLIFRDSKLDKLWKKAEKSGFTQEQLMILHEEFENHQKKLDHHYDTSSIIDSLHHNQKSDNSIENDPPVERRGAPRQELDYEKKARTEHNIHQNLRDKHNELKKDYEKLHKKILDKKLDDQVYEESAVNQLWVQAIRSNFTKDELDMLKEDLENYQVRIKKLKHFQNEMERHNIGSKSKESNSYMEDDYETKHIRKRVEELTGRVDKTHKAIEQMIKSRGGEL